MFFYDYVIVTVLVMFRMGAMFMVIPIFGASNTPMQTKIGLIFFTSLIVIPGQVASFSLDVPTLLDLAQYILTESIIGFSMGLVTLIILNVFYLAGALVDRNIGFAMVSVISAQDESQLPISANFYYIFALMIFIMTNVHHKMIRVILDSFAVMPLGANPIMNLIVFDYVEVLAYSFDMGFRMAAPFIITVLVANVILGLLSKAMPGMNVFMIGMPLKIMLGLFLFFLVMPYYGDFVIEVFNAMMDFIFQLMGVVIW